MKLRRYQELALDFLVQHPKANLYAGCGLGKTLTGLTTIDALHCLENLQRTLVLAPKRVALTVWAQEYAKAGFGPESDVAIVLGTPTQRRAALARKARITVVTYDNIPWLLQELNGVWPFGMVLADESSKLGAHDSVRFKGKSKEKIPGLRHACKHPARWVNMTGTPAANGVQKLWSQTYLLDQGERLGKTITDFRRTWYHPHPRVQHVWLPNQGAEDEIIAAISDITLTLKAEDWFDDLPELVENVIKVPLPEQAREVYAEMQKESIVLLKDTPITAANAAVLTGKLSQITSGFLFTKHPDYEDIHDEKIQALLDVIEETPGPVLVAYQFKPSLARIRQAIPMAQAMDADPETVARWNAGQIPVLLAHPDSAGHGLNLADGGATLVFFDLDWDLETHQQIIERIGPVRQAQAGHPRPVFVHYLVSPRTVDEQILARLQGKAELQDAVLNAMRITP